MNFERAVDIILQHEGGYVNNPKDPGGETNFGITKRVAVTAGYTGPMRDIPMEVVRDIYRAKYWDKINADMLPAPFALAAFDFAVNSGPRRAARTLQRLAGVAADGVIGPKSLAAIRNGGERLLIKYLIARIKFMVDLRHWKHFGKIWAHRMITLTYMVAKL